ncbi:MAG TPA: FUSC family protein [Paraburkholderia sp.]|jgi:hypothetical protein|nr:FUSC family protein [Paraburkholderia sp.]
MDDHQPIDTPPRAAAHAPGGLARCRHQLAHPLRAAAHWLARVDPGTHRRVKGLRLVTAYGIAAALGALHDITRGVPGSAVLGTLAAAFALWASVHEARTARPDSARDLALLCVAIGVGASIYVVLTPFGSHLGRGGAEAALVIGAFLVGYMKRFFGVLGAGLGSMFFIGQLYAYSLRLTPVDLPTIGIAVLIAALASIVPRMLSGPAERPALLAALSAVPAGVAKRWQPEFVMGLQAATASAVVVLLNALIGLEESVWAVTAAVYVVAGSASGTMQRVRRRIVGTLIGVPLGIACLPLAEHAPLLVWAMAALAMVVYAMSMPERYDIACGAFAFVLVVTLAINGMHSIEFLLARAWETLIGGALGLAAAMFIFPLRAIQPDR